MQGDVSLNVKFVRHQQHAQVSDFARSAGQLHRRTRVSFVCHKPCVADTAVHVHHIACSAVIDNQQATSHGLFISRLGRIYQIAQKDIHDRPLYDQKFSAQRAVDALL